MRNGARVAVIVAHNRLRSVYRTTVFAVDAPRAQQPWISTLDVVTLGRACGLRAGPCAAEVESARPFDVGEEDVRNRTL
jgi:hypothetical protein